MPFVKGRYVPESEMQPAAESEQKQNKSAVQDKKRVKEKRLKKRMFRRLSLPLRSWRRSALRRKEK